MQAVISGQYITWSVHSPSLISSWVYWIVDAIRGHNAYANVSTQPRENVLQHRGVILSFSCDNYCDIASNIASNIFFNLKESKLCAEKRKENFVVSPTHVPSPFASTPVVWRARQKNKKDDIAHTMEEDFEKIYLFIYITSSQKNLRDRKDTLRKREKSNSLLSVSSPFFLLLSLFSVKTARDGDLQLLFMLSCVIHSD